MADSKVVLVTGASRGIGARIAATLRSQGHTVFGTSRKAGEGLVALDLLKPESCAPCIAEVERLAGRPLDVLINNAGHDLFGAGEEVSMAELRDQMEANFFGAVALTQAALPGMRARKSGRIIQMSSLNGRVALPFNGAYAASKFALEGWTESLRYEVAAHGIQVVLIAPSGVKTGTLDQAMKKAALSEPAYASNRDHAIGEVERSIAKDGLEVDQVVGAVQRAMSLANPPLRIPVGGQARMIPLLKALLPQFLFERIISGLFLKG